jgi:peptidylprolyl isomerase
MTLALVGCSSSAASGCDRPDSLGSIGSLVTVSGDDSTVAPTVQVSSPMSLDTVQYDDVVTGDGSAIVSENQVVDVGFTLANATTGEVLAAEGYDQPLYLPLNGLTQAMPGLTSALECATGGSRIVVGLPSDQILSSFLEQLRLAEGTPLVAVLDLRSVMLSAADGAPQYNDAHGMPSVVLTDDGHPGVVVPDGSAPSERKVEVLKKGEHDVPTDGSTVVVNVLQVDWKSKRVTKTTWDDKPDAVKLGGDSVVSQTIAGLPIGSQVVVVEPPADASAGASVYVIDILGALG